MAHRCKFCPCTFRKSDALSQHERTSHAEEVRRRSRRAAEERRSADFARSMARLDGPVHDALLSSALTMSAFMPGLLGARRRTTDDD